MDPATLPRPPDAGRAAPPVVRIRARRSGIDRVWGRALAAISLMVVAVVVAVVLLAAEGDTSGPVWMVLPLLPVTAGAVGVICWTWASLRAIDTPIELATTGLVLRSPQGVVRVPWEAVASITHGRHGRTRTVVVRLHPHVGPDAPGVDSTIAPKGWRIVQRHGLRYAAWLRDVDDAGLADAVARTSGGRIRVAAPS